MINSVGMEGSNKIVLEDINDGHFPGGTKVGTKIAKYLNKHSHSTFCVFDNLLAESWRSRAYDYAIEKRRPWGVYIKSCDANNKEISTEALWEAGEYEKAIGLEAVRELVYNRGKNIIGDDANIIHGTAIWCLVSGYDDEVRYHLDYAELYRYETNIIYPPVYAGTCQLSPVQSREDMDGGDFCANVEGVDHYCRFGYKGRLKSSEEFERDLQTNRSWITVPYLQNRGILHDGDFPHLSTKINNIRPDISRVILGFNCFPEVLGECNERAPEHSDAFNRTIKIYQAMASTGIPITSQSINNKAEDNEGKANRETRPKQGLNVKDIAKNPVLARLLITAARKVKESRKEM